MILNIYDDRGMDIISPNNFFLNEIRDEFRDWVIAWC